MMAAAARKDLEVPSSRRGAKGKDSADAWAMATAPAEAEEVKEPVKKLSLEVPASVHRATKAGAAMRGNTMISEVIEMCAARNGMRPWPADVVAQVKAQIAAEEAEGGSEPEAAAVTLAKRTRAPRKRVQ
ncbi:hypothetical protein [Nocardia sp. NPDC059228]|uniref:hypothetical protein n=1 Tax=Nocardia sp. NPDC059228 TaxID=3346777 RepID=UPI0036B6B184